VTLPPIYMLRCSKKRRTFPPFRTHLTLVRRPFAGRPPELGDVMLKGKSALVTGSTSGIGLGIARALAAQGLTAEQMKKMDLNRLRVGQRDQAVHDVKAALLLERVAEEENVQVSDEELNHELEALARQSKQTSEAVRARLTQDGGLDRIRNRIRNEKTLEFLYQQSA